VCFRSLNVLNTLCTESSCLKTKKYVAHDEKNDCNIWRYLLNNGRLVRLRRSNVLETSGNQLKEQIIVTGQESKTK